MAVTIRAFRPPPGAKGLLSTGPGELQIERSGETWYGSSSCFWIEAVEVMASLRRLHVTLAALAVAVCLSACATTRENTRPGPVLFDLSRTQAMHQDGVTANVRIATDDEATRIFGVSLAEHGIQGIWMRLENASDHDYWLLPIAIDPDYFSADEAALVSARRLSRERRAALTETFRAKALPFYLKAGAVNEGFVYASHMRGGRFVDIRLSGNRRAVRMRFAVLLPTQGFDYELSGLRELYARVAQLPDLPLEAARQRTRELPCCTTNADGTGQGDPLNVVFIGSGRDVVSALTASGWYFTEAITVESIKKLIGAAIAQEPFSTAPVSPLYMFEREHDIALQRGRSTISQRNHMRLWLAPFRCEGLPVWVGQVSRDIGVKLTHRSRTLTTHVIDPVVDESREYLLHSLLHHEAVRWFAFARGAGKADKDRPRHNLTGDPYFTDGMRLVIMVSREPVAPQEAQNLAWNESTDPVLEGKGEPATVPAQKR